jgi:hypothetical protein
MARARLRSDIKSEIYRHASGSGVRNRGWVINRVRSIVWKMSDGRV